MSDEIRKIVTVDTSGAINSLNNLTSSVDQSVQSFSTLGDYKNYIDGLNDSLKGLDETSEEYSSTVSKIKEAQNSANFNNLNTSITQTQSNFKSFSTTFTTGIDSLGESLGGLNPIFGAVSSGVKGLSAAFKALIANPIVALIAAIVLVVKGVVDAFKSSEERTQKLKEAFTAFQPVIDAIKAAFGFLADVVIGVVDAIGSVVDFLSSSSKLLGAFFKDLVNGNKEASKAAEEEIKRNKKLEESIKQRQRVLNEYEKNRSLIESNEKKQLSELQSIYDDETKSIKERVEAKRKAVEISESAAKREVQIAQTQIDLIKDQIARYGETEERLKLLRDATIQYNNALSNQNSVIAANKKEINDLNNTLIDASNKLKENKIATLDATLSYLKTNSDQYYNILIDKENKEWELQKTRLQREKYTRSQIEEFEKAHINRLDQINKEKEKSEEDTRSRILKLRSDVYDISSDEYVSAIEEIIKIDQERLLETATNEEERVAIIDSTNKQITQLYIDQANTIAERQIAVNQAIIDSEGTSLKERYRLSKENEELRYQSAINNAELTAKELEALQIEHNNNLVAIENEYNQSVLDQRDLFNQTLLELTDPVTELESYRSLLDQKFELDRIYFENKLREAGFTEEQISLLTAKYDKKKAADDKKRAKAEKTIRALEVASIVSQYSSMLGDISGLFEEGTEAQKAFSIANTVVQTLAGAATAYMTAQELGPIAGPIVGALNAAVCVATGVAQIAKMKSVTTNNAGSQLGSSGIGGGSASGTIKSDAIAFSPDYTAQITAQSDVTNLGSAIGDKRVYVLESDITDAQNSRRVRVDESTF